MNRRDVLIAKIEWELTRIWGSVENADIDRNWKTAPIRVMDATWRALKAL